MGWCAKTKITGPDEATIEEFAAAMLNCLRFQRITEEQLANIDVRPYNGNVVDVGEGINIDVPNVEVEPWANNPIIEKGNVFYIGTYEKNRYIERLTEDDVSVMVYEWIKATYNKKS